MFSFDLVFWPEMNITGPTFKEQEKLVLWCPGARCGRKTSSTLQNKLYGTPEARQPLPPHPLPRKSRDLELYFCRDLGCSRTSTR